MSVEIVPGIQHLTYEGIAKAWDLVHELAAHLHVDVSDGVFTGEGTFRDVQHFRKLPNSDKIELHMMVHNPGHYVDDVIQLNPARCVFHIEAFADGGHIEEVYGALRAATSSELGLAINPKTPTQWLQEQVRLIDYALFMGYQASWTGTKLDGRVFRKIAAFHKKNPSLPIAVDGGVSVDSIPKFVAAGASILCANSAVHKDGAHRANLAQLHHVADTAYQKKSDT